MQETTTTGEVAKTTADEVIKTTQNAVDEVNRFTEYLQEHIPALISFGIKVIFAIIFFCIGRIVIKWIRDIVRKSMERSNADKGVEQFVDSLLKYGLYFLLIFTIATKFGVDTASVAALIASAGVAVGLALQGSLSNFAGGVLILLLKPFKVGDYIIEDSNKNEGTVKEIQIFYTKLSTIDNKTIIIPNSLLTNNSLTNVSEKDERQLDLKIGISYASDLKKAKMILNNLLEQEEEVLKSEERSVFVSELAESAVILGVRAWVKNEEFWTTKWRMLEKIKLTFDENGIEIPYPQMAVHMKN
ncbi:MAG: mechanosensitive ion channel family protein [Lachnospiraceae bacterium]